MLPIEGYGCIGDCRSLALVGTNGSIEWLCWPRFDSPAIFWSLLDNRGGSWSIAPSTSDAARRHYIEDTNVLCTEFDTVVGIGLVHALFVLTVGLPSLPGLHPRMASSSAGPEVAEQLEPPGFWGLNYGLQTPIVVLAAHLVFGAILGYCYRPAGG